MAFKVSVLIPKSLHYAKIYLLKYDTAIFAKQELHVLYLALNNLDAKAVWK
jgi:hypothetical protein